MSARNCFEPSDAGFPWLASAMLAFESCEVIRLRLTMFATGDEDAEREVHLMVNEKVNAMFEAGASLMVGASARSGLEHRIDFFIDHEIDRKSTRLNSSHQIISYSAFYLKKK